MIKVLVKGGLVGLLGILLYNFVILPITIPDLGLRKDWSKEDLEWDGENIFWFIQVTDLHISKYVHLEIKDSLEDFFSTTLDTIKPRLVLASGDLTDGKDKDGVDSFQVLEEWKTYASILEEHNVREKTIYLDIRGNHDSFDVHHLHHSSNLHRNYSAQGFENPSSYIYDFAFRNKTYSFVALDATLKTGVKKVFNFLGQIITEDMTAVLEDKMKFTSYKQIYFGHYPSSCIVAPSPGFKEIIKGGLVYLSGHLHTLGGLAPQLYSIHRSGTPELELGDWKENRKYRVLAIDNGILTFSDNIAKEWPVVLVTNPKQSKFMAPAVEAVQKIRESKEIRILAFSPFGVRHVQVKINSGRWETCSKHNSVPDLYTLPWNPGDLTSTKQTLQVIVEDYIGNKKTLNMQFQTNFDQIPDEYSLYARMILMSDVLSILQFVWFVSILVSMLPLYLARRHSSLLREVYSLPTRTKMMELADFSPFYYLYMGAAISVGFGPWHVGPILSGHIGIIFPWGILVGGQILPSFYPHVFSFTHLFLFHTPLFWSLLYKYKWRVDGNQSRVLLALSNVPVTLVLSAQAILVLLLYYFPSRLGIFREIGILIAPMHACTILTGFIANSLISYYITQRRRK
ncbi:transmembrane protein 62 [Eurytemora carolleeae]|uniref:transmembrane protein 62 n=1 Tax=Eurytemora carolleeae TaxID=1294199 RepID=UPI000C78DEC1|nr:transmembrane protein 62 [Eurytemora carolleeae]|eukprot:XP_023332725.1 transmembrane protein 62-like [Eurytemora affinis]